MNPLVREELCRMVARFGRDIHEDPRRCEALLKDLCPQHKREVHVLAAAAREKVPAELAAPANRAGGLAAIGRLSKRLEDQLALAPQAARWAVESWALALGVVTPKQLAAVQAKPASPPAPPPVVPPPIVARPIVARPIVARPARGAAAAPLPVVPPPVIRRRPRVISQVVVAAVLLILVAGLGMTVLGEAGLVGSLRGPIVENHGATAAAPPAVVSESQPGPVESEPLEVDALPAPAAEPQVAPPTVPASLADAEASSPFTAEERAMVLEEAERIEQLRRSKGK